MKKNEMEVHFPGGMRVNARYKGFTIETDQPVYAGGEGAFPAPFDLFLASIATCAGFYVLFFCEKRGISVRHTSLVMRTEKNQETKMIDKIAIEMKLPSEFPEKYKRAVIRAVNACSVKEHILNPPSFELDVKINES